MPANDVQPAPFADPAQAAPWFLLLYFAKKQQMQWSRKGAHRLLQTRTRTLDGTLRDLFTIWYPAMPATDVQPTPLTVAA
jgi:hypothetical protein